MTVHNCYILHCTQCNQEFNELGESPEEVREFAINHGWKINIKVENGSYWDFCPREICQQICDEQIKLVKQIPPEPEVLNAVVVTRTAKLTAPKTLGVYTSIEEAISHLPPGLHFTKTLSSTHMQTAYGKSFRLTNGQLEQYTYILEIYEVQ